MQYKSKISQALYSSPKTAQVPPLAPLTTKTHTTTGTFRYERAFGVRSLAPSAKDDPMPIDATMWLASCTKFMTTIAVMQCVERGLLKLDEDVTGILHELKGIKILTGFEAGKDGEDVPVLVESKEVMTLRYEISLTLREKTLT